jgi:hypothetical protein
MILTNQWTEFSHGHARTELRLLKSFLAQRGTNSQILSAANDFGDLQSIVSDFSGFIPRQIDRGPIHRKILKYKENQLTKMWEDRVASIEGDSTLVVSSGFWPILLLALKKPVVDKLVFRLISPPKISSVSDSDLKIVLNALDSGRLILGIETLDGQEYLRTHLSIDAEFVPPLSTTSEVLNPSKTGIVWSVTDSTSASRISETINKFEKKNLLIKLPVGIELNQLKCDTTGVEVIPNGISDELFALQIRKLKTVYLPHKNYHLRGSGLITSMLGSGVSVLVHEENSFVRDFNFSNLLVVTNDVNLKNNLEIIEDLKLDRRLEAEKIRTYINTKWEGFLELKNV